MSFLDLRKPPGSNGRLLARLIVVTVVIFALVYWLAVLVFGWSLLAALVLGIATGSAFVLVTYRRQRL